MIPKTKNISWCINSGFTNQEITLINEQVTLFDDLLTTWSFAYDADILTGQCKATNTLQFSVGSCGSAGTGSGNIENYGCVTYSGLTSLTEGATGTAPVGNYQSFSGARAKIDVTDINAKFAAGSPRNDGKRHAMKFVILSTIGLGSRADGGSGTFGSRPTIAGFPLGTVTSGELCRVENFNATNNGDFSIPTLLGSCAGAD